MIIECVPLLVARSCIISLTVVTGECVQLIDFWVTSVQQPGNGVAKKMFKSLTDLIVR